MTLKSLRGKQPLKINGFMLIHGRGYCLAHDCFFIHGKSKVKDLNMLITNLWGKQTYWYCSKCEEDEIGKPLDWTMHREIFNGWVK